MDFSHGAIQWLAADVATTTYTVSGLSFQPKALRFYWVGVQSASDIATETVNMKRGVGFAVSTSARRAAGSFSQDGSASSNCGTVARNDAVACTTDGAGATDGLLDLNAINSDGFQLIVDDAAPQNITVFWEAWGGADITVAQVGDFAEPAATGNQDYTATGFVAGATDQVVMLAGVQSVAAINTAEAGSSGLYVGCAASATAADNIVVSGNSGDAEATMDTDGYTQSDECLALCDKPGAAVANARAVLTQFGTDNFRLNWIERGVTSRKSIYMALKGGRWKSGSTTIDLATVGNTVTVSGLQFTPIGMSLMWHGVAESTVDAFTATDQIGLGTGTSTTSRRSMASRDEDATANAEIDLVIEYDQVLCYANSAGTSGRALDIDAMNSDGFRLIVDSNQAAVTAWVGYLTFGPTLTVTPGTLATVLSAFAPTVSISNNQTVTPGVLAQTLTAFAPTVNVGSSQTVTPGITALSLSTFAPAVTVSNHQAVTPGTASLSLSAFAPTVLTPSLCVPGVATATISVFAPTVTVTAASTLTPGSLSLSISTFAPTVAISDHQTVTPGTASLSLSTFAPVVSTPRLCVPGIASLTISAFVPTVTVSSQQIVIPGTASLTVSLFAPTVTTTAHVTVTPGVASLTLAAFAPSITSTQNVWVTPDFASLTLATFAPSVRTELGLVNVVSVVAHVAPTVAASVSVTPQAEAELTVSRQIDITANV